MIPALKGIFVLTVFYLLGAVFAGWTSLGVPGAIFGLLFCLGALIAFPRLLEQVRPGALVMLALVPLFLVPLLSRMPLTLDFANWETWLIVAATAVSTVVGIVITGLVVKLIIGERP